MKEDCGMYAFVKRAIVIAAAGIVSAHMGTLASAAVIQAGPAPVTPATVNLTTTGTTDWAYWARPNGTALVDGAPTEKKSGVTSVISGVTAIGTSSTGVRGFNGATNMTFAWSDGTNTTSANNIGSSAGAVGDALLDAVGSGVQLTVKGDPSALTTVYVYVTGYNATGTLSATLNGAPAYTEDDSVSWGSTYSGKVFTVSFTPDSVDDLLTIRFGVITDGAATSSRVALQAVAVATAPVPEPASLGMVGLIAGGMMLMRRGRLIAR